MIKINLIQKKTVHLHTHGPGACFFFPNMAQCDKLCETGLALLDHTHW